MTGSNTQNIAFKTKAWKRQITKFVREGWYTFTRAPLEKLIWVVWSRFGVVGDKAISRRNGINRLNELTWMEVAPSSIKYYVLPDDVDRKHFLWQGDWDRRVQLMSSHQRFKLMEDLWQHRDNLEKSQSYQPMLKDLEKGITHKHLNRNMLIDSPAKALELLESQTRIFHSLMENGYKAELATDEIKVAVDRHGNLIKANGGRKRLSAAIICALPSIPVRIAYIHQNWLNQFINGSTSKEEAAEAALMTVREAYRIKEQ
ncbi:MAG: hypothetical protein ACQEW7_13765 [Pseudomonadota bacterium]